MKLLMLITSLFLVLQSSYACFNHHDLIDDHHTTEADCHGEEKESEDSCCEVCKFSCCKSFVSIDYKVTSTNELTYRSGDNWPSIKNKIKKFSKENFRPPII